MTKSSKLILGLAVAGVSVLSAGAANAELVVATTLQGVITTFDSATPGTLISGYAIQGIASNEVIRSIDYRPSTGLVYAVGGFGNIYTLDYTTGQATFVTKLFVANGNVPANGPSATPILLNGSSFGSDFNPVPDLLRITSNADQNLRASVGTGATAIDSTLAYAASDVNAGRNPNIVFSAYTNSFVGATTTTLYGIDAGNATLVTQAPPNSGTLNTVGPLLAGTDINEFGGFDISGATGTAYASLIPVNNNQSSLYTIDLGTGAATLVGQISGGSFITGLTVIPVVPEPAAVGLLAPAALAVLARRRR